MGISPSITFLQFWLGNPSEGLATGQWQNMSLIDYGLELDMKKIAKVPGGTIHFHELFVPLVHNTGKFGEYAADIYGGQPGPFIPVESHLTRFTWEQHLAEDRLQFEFGKANAGDWYAIPVCNTVMGCESLMTEYDGGMGQMPTPYAEFLGRIRYKATKKLSVDVAEWRSTGQFPWTDGWELGKTNISPAPGHAPYFRSDSNVYLVDIQYKSAMTTKYPGSFEGAYFHNTAKQNCEMSSGTGYCNPVKDFHDGTNGMYAAGRQTFYRFDGGRPGPPRAVTAFAQLNQSFDSKNVSGLATDFKTGFFVSGLFKDRPIDSYGFNIWTAHVTNDEQAFLTQQYATSFPGKTYNVPRTEVAIGPDANFVFKNVILSPFALYTFNANSYMNPSFGLAPGAYPLPGGTTGKISNGWGVGATLVILVDKIFGLGSAMF
jgi:porin